MKFSDRHALAELVQHPERECERLTADDGTVETHDWWVMRAIVERYERIKNPLAKATAEELAALTICMYCAWGDHHDCQEVAKDAEGAYADCKCWLRGHVR